MRIEVVFPRPLEVCFLPGSAAVLLNIQQQLQTIMSKITEFGQHLAEHQQKVEAAIDGLSTDIQGLKAKIEELQSTQGQITPEDQAILDEIETRVGAVASRLAALDDITPPTVPDEP